MKLQEMGVWAIAAIIALLLLGVVFALGFFGITIYMKHFTGHSNEVVVPDVEGLLFDVARKECRSINLYVQQFDSQHSDTVEKGYIISQNPKAGFSAKSGRAIEVVVSAGPETVDVPSLFNLTVAAATDVLLASGLKPGQEIHQFNDRVNSGHIFYSEPTTGTEVGRGSFVKLYISSGDWPSGTRPRLDHQRLLDDAGN
ncbi:MAG: PASTA domain-containing protein [Candidatus Cloacimonetes bacterium]|nr:PASTA domain-containing protein [Candidatus Cloacimonadota bacterium]